MQKTNISWTEFTWNPLTGCPLSLVSSGCSNCYARNLHNKRHKAYLAGKKLPKQYAKPFEEIQFFTDRLNEPLHKQKPCKIFVGSMTELFAEAVPFEFIADVLSVGAVCRQHIFQILTKRPRRMLEIFTYPHLRKHIAKRVLEWDLGYAVTNPEMDEGWPLPNLWLGVSVENQKRADERIPILLQMPAAVRFISFEPLLEYIDCERTLKQHTLGELFGGRLDENRQRLMPADWLIYGCESGCNRRPCESDWIRKMIKPAQSVGIPVFVKQLSINGKVEHDINKFPKDLQLREYPK